MIKETEAKCDGLMLTVGFPTANPPLVWRFDLERNHSFTLSLQGGAVDWQLGVTSPKGDFYTVAHFGTREEADDALAKVGTALAKKKPAFTSEATPTILMTRALTVVGCAAALILVVIVVFTFVIHKPRTASGTVSVAPAVMRDGVPLSADDVLKPPQ